MGFSIGSFLGKIAAPILGAVFGPVGAIVGGAVASGFGPGSAGSSQVGPTALPAQLRFPIPKIGPGISGIGIGGAAISVISALLNRAREFTGGPVSAKKIKEAVKVCGIAQASQIFGLSESEICMIIVSIRRRRARGISAVDLRRTRSTIRKVHNITHDLQRLRPSVRRHHK